MPASPSLPTTITAGTTTGHITHSQTVHAVVNSIYQASIGTVLTTNTTLSQSNSGEVIQVNSTGAITITAPTLTAGSTVELVRMNTGSVTVAAGSGVTLLIPNGSYAIARVQYSSLTLLWLTSSTVLVGGDIT